MLRDPQRGRVSGIGPAISKRLRIALLVWLAIVGLDFLLNGALSAGLYQQGGPFLLPPADAAARIPLGYLAFGVIALGTVEVMHRLRISGSWTGARLGAVVGATVGSVWSLSLYSITTIDAWTAGWFFVVWLGLLALGATVAGSGLASRSLRGLSALVVGMDVLFAAVVIALQSAGLVPTTSI
jgi:hypothetical protein